MNTVLIGKFGEDTAQKYLLENGYKILKRNYRAAGGEIDIIAKKGDHLSFVEVKSRADKKYGYAADAVNYPKQPPAGGQSGVVQQRCRGCSAPQNLLSAKCGVHGA